MPGVPPAAAVGAPFPVEPTLCDPAGGGVHNQVQAEPSVGALAASPAGVPSPVHVQSHDHWSPGAPVLLPGRTSETLRLEPPVTFTTPRSALVPEAVAVLA